MIQSAFLDRNDTNLEVRLQAAKFASGSVDLVLREGSYDKCSPATDSLLTNPTRHPNT